MKANRRILIVDDQEDLRLQVARLLRKEKSSEARPLLDQIRKRFARNHAPAAEAPGIQYDVETVGEGQLAFEQVKESTDAGNPFAVLFLDMRMPGWDGLRTAQNIRAVDKDIEIVIMTAYADYNQEELVQQIGVAEKLLYLKKPFQPEEIRQLARALTEKWNLTQRERERLLLTNRLMNESTALTRGVQRNLGETARAILGAFVSFLDADLGIVARTLHGELEVCAITHPAQQGALVERISAVGMPERRRTDDTAQTAYFPIRFEDFEGFIYLEGKGISFDFEQLEPFLDILSETAREVLKNMFLLQQHSREKRLAVLGTAMQRIAGVMSSELEQLKEVGNSVRTAGTKKVPELCDKLDRSILRLEQLSKNISRFNKSGTQELNRRSIRVHDLVQAAFESCRERLEEFSIDMHIQEGHDLKIEGDHEVLEFSIARLIKNSINALRTQPVGSERRIVAHCERVGKNAKITLTDTGSGIADEIRDRLFDPFQASGDGLGLGTTIANQAISQHGGCVRAESADQGAKFVVLLPLLTPE